MSIEKKKKNEEAMIVSGACFPRAQALKVGQRCTKVLIRSMRTALIGSFVQTQIRTRA
jgi:hypothetical protein